MKQRVKKSLDFVRVVRSTVIPTSTETNVEVDCLRSGTLILEPADELYTRRKIVIAWGLVEVHSEGPFNVRVANFSDTPARPEVGRKIGYAIKASYVKALED